MSEDIRESTTEQSARMDEAKYDRALDDDCGSIETPVNRADSASSAVDELTEIQSHTHRLLDLLSDLKTVTDRACIAALRESESADRMEESMADAIDTLRDQLEERDADLQAKDEAIKRLDTIWKTKYQRVEACARAREAQLAERESELQAAKAEAEQLGVRLLQAEAALERVESGRGESAQRFEAELAAVRLQLLSKEACLQEKEQALRKSEAELRVAMQNHRLRLQQAEGRFAYCETELKHKQSLIDAAALRENEIGKLIKRLSSECEKLTRELQEKTALLASLEDKNHTPAGGGKVWKKVIGLMQDQPL